VKAIFLFELKCFLSKKSIRIAIFLLFLFSMMIIQSGLGEYRKVLKDREKFQEIGSLNVSDYNNDTQYGIYGIRAHLVPYTFSILFPSSGVFEQMSAISIPGSA